MRMYDILVNKRDGKELSDEEISFFIKGYTKGEIPDYQASALLMAIFLKGMNERETVTLTKQMAYSGDVADLTGIGGIKVDKHSTGGVGDKTTLIAGPIAAACGVKVAKMSGRGLGHTGGTIDKLEAISGFQTVISKERFHEIVNSVGISVISQSGNLAPADKKLYALRDVTGTVDNLSLIAASIMSKKIASGADAIVLDVKTGSGAFMANYEGSLALAKEMVSIGTASGKRTVALITNMDIPLGHEIGNSLEVKEAIMTLKGKGPEDLTKVSLALAAEMLYVSGRGSEQQCLSLAQEAIVNGEAFKKLKEMVKAQGGQEEYIENPENFEKARVSFEVKSSAEGYISHMDTKEIGIASVILGAGRETKESALDYSAGITLLKKTGDQVKTGDVVALMHTSKEKLAEIGAEKFLTALTITRDKPSLEKLIISRVENTKITNY